jgi:hypothetical protein
VLALGLTLTWLSGFLVGFGAHHWIQIWNTRAVADELRALFKHE